MKRWELSDGLKANVDRLRGTTTGRQTIAALDAFFAENRPATPQEVAEARHAVASTRKTAQTSLDLEPPSCA